MVPMEAWLLIIHSQGSHLLTVTPAPISFTGTRQYNATTDVEAANITLTGLQGGEDLTVTGDGSISSGNVGAGKAANSSGLTLGNGVSGTAGTASNYTFTGGTHTFDVTQRVLNSSGSKTYDGNTNAVASDVTLSNLAGGETLSHSGTATLGSKNVGSSTISNLSGISIANGTGAASNYTLTGGTHNFTVNKRVVNVSGTRLYNALNTAVASDLSTMTNLVGSETLVLSNSGTLANANVGSNKTVTIGSLSLGNGSNGGLAGNYTLTGGTHQLTVNQRPLNATLARQYDATTTAAGSTLSSFDALQGGETLTMTGSGTAASANVANGIAMSSNGNLALADGTGAASNYSLNSTVINITQRVLNSSGSKTYDGNTNAVASDVTLSNLAGGETLSHSGTATLGSKNVGSSTISNLSGISIANGTGAASNYTLTGGTHNFTVNKRVVNVSGTRLYNALNTAVASDLSTMTNLVGSETLVLSNSGTLANANVGSNKTVTIGSLSLGNGSNGGLAANYTLTGGTHQLTVNPAVISFTGSRQYDGSTAVNNSNITLTGQQGGEDLTLSGAGSISSKNVGSGKAVNVSGLTLGNGTTGTPGAASNYTFTGGTQTFDVTQRVLDSSGSRTYDATSSVSSGILTLSNLIGSETLTLSGSGTLSTAAAGANKSIGVGTLTLGNGSNGGLAANYVLSGGSHLLTVSQKPINITGTRVYDGTTDVLASNVTLNGLQGGESLAITGTGSISSKNVGSGKTVTLGSLALGNGSGGTPGTASNYTFTGGTHTFDVTKRNVTFNGTRTYDGTQTVNASDLTTIINLVGSETLTFSGSGTVTSANVGTGKSITNGSLALVNGTGLASNYNLTTGTYDITKRWVNFSGSRAYDATTSVSNSVLTMSNLVSGETLGISGSGTIASAEIGAGKSVSVGSLALVNGSGLASNYTFGTLSVNVTQRAVTISGSKIYDGSTTVGNSNISTINNLAGGETLLVTGSGSITSAEVASSKTLNLGTIALANNTGTASNYSLASGTFDVTARPVTMTGSRVYDGSTTVANSDLTTFNNVVSGETLAINGSGTVSSKNVGNSKSVTLGSLSLANNTGSASNYSLSSATLNIVERPLNISSTRSYDATTSTNSSNLTFGNLVGSETINKSGTISTSSANAGSYTSSNINTTSLSLSDGANGGC